MLPAAHPGEMNLTSMNGERRMRLSERFMDPPGSAMPDCLIAAAIANTLKRMYEAEGKSDMAARFAGFDWKTEEDAFNDGFRQAGQAGVGPIDSQGGKTGNLVTYARLRAMGNNGVQLPAKSFEGGKLIGTEMLYMDGKFDTADGKAQFKPARVDWPAEAGGGSEGEVQILDQQRPRQRSLADPLSRPVQRVRARTRADGFSRAPTRTTRVRSASRPVTSSRSITIMVRPTRWPTSARDQAWPDVHAVRAFQRDHGQRDDPMDGPERRAVLQGHVGEPAPGGVGSGFQGNRELQEPTYRRNLSALG
jgi:anaerobic selenocysteine-containing dehydrogenase